MATSYGAPVSGKDDPVRTQLRSLSLETFTLLGLGN